MGPLLNIFKQQYECGWTGLNKGVSQLTGGAVLAPLGFLASFPSNQLWKQLGMVQIHQKNGALVLTQTYFYIETLVDDHHTRYGEFIGWIWPILRALVPESHWWCSDLQELMQRKIL